MLKSNQWLFLLVVFSVCLLFSSGISFAETKTFVKEYTYMASDIDSKMSSRAIALDQVKRALLEQLGTYLISETDVKNFQMTKDQITAFTAGIVKTEILDEKWNGAIYYLKAKISADPDEVAKTVDLLRQDKQTSKELEDVRKRADDLEKEIARLKQELIAKSDSDKQKQYNNAIDELATITDDNSFLFKKIIVTKEDEKMIATVNANLVRGIEGVGGRIRITNKRLLFESHRVNVQDRPEAIMLNQIAEIKKKNLLFGIVSTGMVIRLKNGKEYTFVVQKREELIQLIQSLHPNQ